MVNLVNNSHQRVIIRTFLEAAAPPGHLRTCWCRDDYSSAAVIWHRGRQGTDGADQSFRERDQQR